MIHTPINWNFPKEKTPPFGKQILAVFGGHGTNDAGHNWARYFRISSIVMLKTTPNCDGQEDYKDFQLGGEKFSDFQFFCVDSDKHEYEADLAGVLDIN